MNAVDYFRTRLPTIDTSSLGLERGPRTGLAASLRSMRVPTEGLSVPVCQVCGRPAPVKRI